jgi:hypothetical protein
MTQQDRARVIVAVAAEADDEFIWSRLDMLPELFAAGPVAIRFGYFGAEGALSARPFIATQWATDAGVLAELIDRGRARCVCGCFVQIGDILEQALQEARQAPVQAVVIIGGSFHGDLDAATATAKQLRAAGVRLFLFQQGRSDSTERAFRRLAAATDGGYFQFNPHVERVAERLPRLVEAVTQFALGGLPALRDQDSETASLLLEQMTADKERVR